MRTFAGFNAKMEIPVFAENKLTTVIFKSFYIFTPI
jgi:hypothetical protein